MSTADDIKARLDILDYIQQYVPLKRAGRTYKACCPFHSEKTPSFVVDPDRQTWRCFGSCATGGDIFSFAQKLHGWSFVEALQELGKQAGIDVRPQTPEEKARGERLDGLRGLLQTAAEAFHEALLRENDPAAAEVRRYAMEKRGFSLDTIQRFGIGYALTGWTYLLDYLKTLGYTDDQIVEVGLAVRGDSGRVYDRFRSRLMIPIRDERGRVIGFGARALNPDDNPKYLNSPQTPLFDKSRTLFALDAAKASIRDSGTAVIVEGYMDAVQAHQAGFTNVVAQMGTATTEAQLTTLAKLAKRIVLALDADAAGQNATRRSLDAARAALQADYTGRLSVDIRILHIPDAKDPDDVIREHPERWQALVDAALPAADYLIQAETAALPANASLPEREAAARRLLPMLLASESDLYTQDNLQKLALRLHIAERDLLVWAAEQKRITAARPPRPAAPPDVPAPPEVPPLDFDHLPPPDDGGSAPAIIHAPAKPAARPAHDREGERYCLRLLLLNPDGYYAVNRRLRELANGSRVLLDGPLADWDANDFTQAEYRALMEACLQALAQDEREFYDDLRQRLNQDLCALMDTLLLDELEAVRVRLRFSFAADLDTSWGQMRRDGAVSATEELVEKALRLRLERLRREREELSFLQMDAQASGDNAAGLLYSQQVVLSGQAKRLIDVALQRQTSQLRS